MVIWRYYTLSMPRRRLLCFLSDQYMHARIWKLYYKYLDIYFLDDAHPSLEQQLFCGQHKFKKVENKVKQTDSSSNLKFHLCGWAVGSLSALVKFLKYGSERAENKEKKYMLSGKGIWNMKMTRLRFLKILRISVVCMARFVSQAAAIARLSCFWVRCNGLLLY